MSQASNNLSGDPSQLTIQQKVELFEKSSDEKNGYLRPLTYYNDFPAVKATKAHKKYDIITSSDNNASTSMTNSTSNNNNTSTPVSSAITRSYSEYPRKVTIAPDNKRTYETASRFSTSIPNNLSDTINRIIHENKSATSYYNSPDSRLDSSVNMKEFDMKIKNLDTFLVRDLNEFETQKRIGMNNTEIYKRVDREKRYVDQILDTLDKMKEEINEIKVSQKGFEDKIRKQVEYQNIPQNIQPKKDDMKKRYVEALESLSSADSDIRQKISYVEQQKLQHAENKRKLAEIPKVNNKPVEKKYNSPDVKAKPIVKQKVNAGKSSAFDSPILASSGGSREERIGKLEAEIYKEETFMMKINRVLENLKNVDDSHLLDIMNMERHYLVASTRFQSALSELRKLNEGVEMPHQPPYNRKGRLLIRDIMLEVKPTYFQRPLPIRNEFLLIMMKYEDKVFATKPMRIIDDVRVVKFTEKFSIPEIYMDFDMRLEIYGTTFWRKNASVRETMLKKYGFITFSLADTANKSKRFQMIEVLQTDNVPIRNKVMMKISQKITTNVQYVGNLYVKIKDIWHDATAHLNGHLLEISFKRVHNSGINRTQETMLLDLYNVDSDAVIPVDVQRISDKPYTFLLKFNHYVDVANFYLMLAAESSETYSEWINALNKVLVLIK